MNNKATKLVALLLIMTMLLAGCVKVETTSRNEEVDKKEFEILSEDHFHDNLHLTVVRHKETGKRFIIYTGYRKGGITPLD